MRGSAEPDFRPMERGDLGAALRIIAQHDEDDFEEAREELKDSLDGMFVIRERGKIVGLTGATQDPHSEDVVWLSWTYVDATRQGNGLGRMMFDALSGMLAGDGVRKMFINTSDYREAGVDTYAAARAFYGRMGARLEVTIPDYHAPGEARLVYGLEIAPEGAEAIEAGSGALRFVDIETVEESEDGWGLVWEEVQGTSDPAAVDPGLDKWVSAARSRRARVLFAAVPSDLCQNLNGPFGEHGFAHHGRLLDYFGPGVHQELGSLKLY